ncbi:MAG: BMP family ABC transporter substrate-binding protein [Candidatus Limnocylindrales bacterium]
MQKRLGVALFAGMAIIVTACGSGTASTAPSVASVAPSVAPSAAASEAPSTEPSAAPQSDLKIGLVTDVGTLDDKNFNQYSWEGAQAGADAIAAPAPQSAVSKVSANIATNIQAFVDAEYDIIVTVGFAAGADTIKAAKANPTIKFIGVDQGICIDADGEPDGTFTCAGDAATLLPNLQGINWKEQQPGYLAGIVAASLSKTGQIAAVGGTAVVPAVTNYILGYRNGAMSINPAIKVEIAYVSEAPDTAAFGDPSGGLAFGTQMLTQFPDVDVIFQVAGATGNGVLQAACDKGILAIGVDVDQVISAPATAKCTVVSAEKKLVKNVSDAIKRIADGTDKGGKLVLDLTTEDVGLSPYHDFESQITPDIQAKVDAAIEALKDGSLKACEETPFGGCDTTK